MTPYISDRSFTDYIHKNIAIPKIYNPLGWSKIDRDTLEAEHDDIFNGIDYAFNDGSKMVSVQERFREKKYAIYSDFTIRYRRDRNALTDRHESEYYKMKANYFVYGITNCEKIRINNCSDFLKYAVVDLEKVYSKLDEGLIIISDNNKNNCEIVDGKIICPIKYNRDGSSSFFPIEISHLINLWGPEMVIAQKGFI